MNINFLKELAKTNPALARAINIGLLGSVAVLLSIAISKLGNLNEYGQIFIPLLTAIMAYVDKVLRDLSKE